MQLLYELERQCIRLRPTEFTGMYAMYKHPV
jgi:hypothetical protein